MVDYMAKKNSINDICFEKNFYEKYVTKIKSFQEYKELEVVVKRMDLQILFSYTKDETPRYIQYEIGFKICDKNSNMISVRKESELWDYMANMLSFFPVINYNKFTKKIVVSEIDRKEFVNDCNLFIKYLEECYC